jgi:signal transduction histidine kinase
MTPATPVGSVRPVPDLERVLAPLRRLPPLAVDAGLAAVVAVVSLASIVVDDRNDPSIRLTVLGIALLAAQVVPLVWRRRAPLAVAVVVIGAAVAYGVAELPDPAIMFAPALALYSVAAYRPQPISLVVAVGGAAAGIVALVLSADADVADVAVNYVVGITSWAVGLTVRNQREHTARVEAQREADARRAATDERIRIARELHDVVAHHLSVIVVQAEAAQEVLAARPERAGKAMATVADTARSALGELRRVLGVLRSEGGVGDGGRAPQPDLDAVDDLVASVREAGLTVAVRTEGEPRAVGGVVGVAAYRVVQEALTNVLRHAAARRAEVALDYGPDALVVIVSDDGRGCPSASDQDWSAGHGLAGMRERVTILGGSLDAGPRAEGGFTVRARLPLEPARP